METPATAVRPGHAEHYDAFRDLYYPKPRLRGWAHLICFEIALVVGTLMIVDAHGARETSVAAIYAAAVAGLHHVAGQQRLEPREVSLPNRGEERVGQLVALLARGGETRC